MSFPIGVQLYSVRDDMEKDFEGTLRKVREMGYDGVEFAGLFGRKPEEVKSLLDEIGLVPVSAHVAFDIIAENPEKVISDYAKVGCKYIAIPYLVEERRPGAKLFDETVEALKNFAAIGRRYGITFLYHNHDFEFEKKDGKYLLDILYDTLSADDLQSQLDTCWVKEGGEDPAKYIEKYAGRAPLVHLKDYYRNSNADTEKLYNLIGIDDSSQEAQADEEDDGFCFRVCGSGLQDFPAMLEACKKAGTSWLIVEMDMPEPGKTPMDSIRLSVEYLKTINK